MTSFIAQTTIDCRNAYEISTWWKEVLGFADLPGDPNEPEHPECAIRSADGRQEILFVTVPEDKTVKNRVHFDLRPESGTREQEVERLTTLGAVEIADERNHYGPNVGWVVMQDPEGNEFCVLRGLAEIEASGVSSEG